MKPSLFLVTVSFLFVSQASAMSWIPSPMYGVPAIYPRVIQQYPAPSANYVPIVGNDRDLHGCIGSAGYQWCELKGKCIRPWEETCQSATPMVGNDRDAYGCIPSAGYQWCAAKQKCLRSWEESCQASTAYVPNNTTYRYSPTVYDRCDRGSGYLWCAAKQACIQPWIEDCASPWTSRYYPTPDNTVVDSHGCITSQGYYWCEAQNTCIPSGSTCIARRATTGRGYFTQPWDAFGCDTYAGERWCDSKQACIRAATDSCPNDPYGYRGMMRGWSVSSSISSIPVYRDENGCRSNDGYKWCSSLNKCYRPWEERCVESVDPVRETCLESLRAQPCIGSPGFKWCETKRACVRMETKCR